MQGPTPQQGAAARWTRIEEPSRKRSSRFAHRLLSYSPLTALVVNGSRGGFPMRRPYLGRRVMDFPQGRGLLAPTAPSAAYLAPARLISCAINWGTVDFVHAAVDFARCGRLAARTTYFPRAHGLLAPSPTDFGFRHPRRGCRRPPGATRLLGDA